MSTNYQKAIAQAEIEGVLKDLALQSHSDIVLFADGTTLTAKVAELLADIALKASTADLDARIDALVNGAPEALDTLKEIADAIAENETLMGALNEAIGNKVSKEDGKSLIANELITKLQSLENYDDTEVRGLIANKVEKEAGKGLSTNDYDNEAVEEVAKIANKVDKVVGKGLSTEDFTTEEKTKLAGAVTFRVVE